MKRDPAFLFYDGDAARDVSHMNRLERGAYFDLMQAQRKFKGFTIEQAKKILGNDFDLVWSSLELILTCEDGLYFIDWVKDSTEKRKRHCELQSERSKNYWNSKKDEENIPRDTSGIPTDIPRKTRGIPTDIPLENENENENENINVRHDIFIDKNIYKNNNICREEIPGGETSLVQASPSHEVTGQGEEPVFKEKKKAPVRERNAATYADEVRVDNLDPSFSAYKKLVGYILGANPSGEPYWNVLSINKQFTFNQFMRVVSRAKGSDIEAMNTIIGYIDSIENNKSYAKKYDSLPSTVTNWMNRAGLLKPIVTQKVS